MAVSLRTKILTLINVFKEPKILLFLISQRFTGYFYDIGWYNSFKKKSPIDSNYEPLPWFTYPFIDFIKTRLKKNQTLFEFGSGNSTLFFANFVDTVISIEHNKEWYNKLYKRIPKNVSLYLIDSTNNYSNSIKAHKQIDIIVIDGEHRLECIYKSIGALSKAGVIILDDSERAEYNEGINYLLNSGFRKIDFSGISPGLFYKKLTTIFYRTGNCLDI